MQNIIAAKNEVWKIKPQTKEDWKKFSDIFYESGSQNVKNLIEYYKVEITDETINNVPCYWVRPNGKYDKDKVLIFLHGGGYVFGYGKSSLTESVYMAWVNGYQVLAIDYRMASEYPYPAAVDDALAVYKEILKKFDNKKIGVFGTSTGGGMTLILTQMAKDNKLPLPAAIAPLTPWTDVAKIGDSYYTNEKVDNSLVSYDGWLEDATKAYANGHDLKDPYLSPVYGDTTGFPPTLLVSGTRDLFLSCTVRMQQNLLEHNVPTNLIVYEGQSHAQYYFGFNTEETLFHFKNLKNFFNKNLK